MTKTFRVIAAAFMKIALPLAAGIAMIWLTGELRVFGLVMVATAVVAALGVYFDWREKWVREMLVEPEGYQDLDQAA